MNQDEAIAVMLKEHERVKEMYRGFDYSAALRDTPEEHLSVIAGAMEWILEAQRKAAERETSDAAKNRRTSVTLTQCWH